MYLIFPYPIHITQHGAPNPQKNENLNSIFEFLLNASILKVALSCVCIKVKIINSLKLRITPHLQNEFIW